MPTLFQFTSKQAASGRQGGHVVGLKLGGECCSARCVRPIGVPWCHEAIEAGRRGGHGVRGAVGGGEALSGVTMHRLPPLLVRLLAIVLPGGAEAEDEVTQFHGAGEADASIALADEMTSWHVSPTACGGGPA
jgi:hypothetical protein